MKKLVLFGIVGVLAACGPAQQPPPDQAAQPPPPAAQTAPAAAPAPAPTAAPAPAAPSAADQEETRLKAEERKVKREEAELRAQRKAQQVEAQQVEAQQFEAQQAAAPAPPPQPACQDCGVIASITPISKEGQAGWLGTLGGAAAGGLAGSQFGKGKGNTAMTVIGVLGGALAGREVQKRVDTTTVYQIAVNMEAGGTRTVTIDRADGLTVGSRVHVDGNNLMPY